MLQFRYTIPIFVYVRKVNKRAGVYATSNNTKGQIWLCIQHQSSGYFYNKIDTFLKDMRFVGILFIQIFFWFDTLVYNTLNVLGGPISRVHIVLIGNKKLF